MMLDRGIMKKTVPVVGDTQVVTGFLWFPRTIGDRWRWLEKATRKRKLDPNEGNPCWVDLEWVD